MDQVDSGSGSEGVRVDAVSRKAFRVICSICRAPRKALPVLGSDEVTCWRVCDACDRD